VVTLSGSGHDATDSDLTGCIAQALRRFVADRAVGSPCRGRFNGLRPFPRPPRSIRQFRSAPGVGGERGRALFAVLDTVQDAVITAGQLQDARLPLRGGGLRGGGFNLSENSGRLRLRGYSFVPGVRVTGTLATGTADITGRVSVRGPRNASGFLRITRTGATGRLGGRAVVYRARGAAAAAAAGAGRRTGERGADLPALAGALLGAPARRRTGR